MQKVIVPLLLLFLAQSGLAAPIWFNGDRSDNGGFNMTQFAGADDFVLATPVILESIFFRAFSLDLTFANFSGTAGWAIHVNDAGLPGPIIASGVDVSPSRIDTAINLPFTDDRIFEVELNVGSLLLTPGTYWLALRDGPIGSPGDDTPIFWQTSVHDRGFDLKMDSDPLTPEIGWNPTEFRGNDFNFELHGRRIPEPATLLLIFGGLAALCLPQDSRRRNPKGGVLGKIELR